MDTPKRHYSHLGSVLLAADLLAKPQLELALNDQAHYWELRLGEILDLRGWVRQQTSDFFADQFTFFQASPSRYQLGFYLKAAALLDQEQIHAILQQQQQTTAMFGTLAVVNGWLKQTTLDFFLGTLCHKSSAAPVEHQLINAKTTPETSTAVIPKTTMLQLDANLNAWVG